MLRTCAAHSGAPAAGCLPPAAIIIACMAAAVDQAVCSLACGQAAGGGGSEGPAELPADSWGGAATRFDTARRAGWRRAHGLPSQVAVRDVVTAGSATAEYLARNGLRGAYVIGEPGLLEVRPGVPASSGPAPRTLCSACVPSPRRAHVQELAENKIAVLGGPADGGARCASGSGAAMPAPCPPCQCTAAVPSSAACVGPRRLA
jgi:hypothetical protein